MEGWISLHRKIRKNPIFNDHELLRLWLICLTEATHKERDQMVGRQKVRLIAGQFVTGRFDLETMYNSGLKRDQQKSPITVWRWLEFLQTSELVIINSNNKFSVVSIANWDKYQNSEQENDQQMINKRSTNDQQMITNNNVNNLSSLDPLKDITTIPTSTRSYKDNPFSLFETHKFGKLDSMSRDIIGDTIDTYTEEWVIRAIKESVKANVVVWNYVEKILKRWKITEHPEPWTLEKEETQPQKQGNVRQFSRPSTDKPKLPIITDGPKSSPLSDEKKAELMRMAELLDGDSTGTDN